MYQREEKNQKLFELFHNVYHFAYQDYRTAFRFSQESEITLRSLHIKVILSGNVSVYNRINKQTHKTFKTCGHISYYPQSVSCLHPSP